MYLTGYLTVAAEIATALALKQLLLLSVKCELTLGNGLTGTSVLASPPGSLSPLSIITLNICNSALLLQAPAHILTSTTQTAIMASLACSQRLTAQPSTSTRCMQTPVLRPIVSRRSVAVRATKLPEGVTLPPRTPESPESKFGFVKGAERLNSRAAMLGFFGILLVEAIAHKGVFEMAGFEVGRGLGFEF